jgi:PleD family two-component response regulator
VRARLGCSMGLATWAPGEPTIDGVALMEQATDALVEARLGGGDQVAIAG